MKKWESLNVTLQVFPWNFSFSLTFSFDLKATSVDFSVALCFPLKFQHVDNFFSVWQPSLSSSPSDKLPSNASVPDHGCRDGTAEPGRLPAPSGDCLPTWLVAVVEWRWLRCWPSQPRERQLIRTQVSPSAHPVQPWSPRADFAPQSRPGDGVSGANRDSENRYHSSRNLFKIVTLIFGCLLQVRILTCLLYPLSTTLVPTFTTFLR